MAPTYGQMVEGAIRALKDPNGSSTQAISKYIKATHQKDDKNSLKRALKKGLADGKLVNGDSAVRFKIAGLEFADTSTQVAIEDVRVGDGEAAAKGDQVRMQYVGTLSDGSCFDRAAKFDFQLGAGDVIKGWDRGIVGMKVGGVRKLVVPSELGYGKKGSGPAHEEGHIPPGATLSFTVTLKQIL